MGASFLALCLLLFVNAALPQSCSEEVFSPYAVPGSPPPDFPGYQAVDTVIPVGSLVIPMDNTYQSHKIDAVDDSSHVWFNIRAYGYVKELRKAQIPVEWVMKNFKQKDDADIENVSCFPINPPFIASSAASSTSRSFGYGPFVVFPEYRAAAESILDVFHPAPSDPSIRGWNVAVYETTSEVTVNIRQHLNHRVHIAVSEAGPNSFIHRDFLVAAGFTTPEDFEYVTAANIQDFGEDTCFSILTEPHFIIGNPKAYTDPVRSYLQSGGNMLAECEAIRTYETAHFLTSAGLSVPVNNLDSLEYPNPSVPFVQMEGDLDETTYGSVPDFQIDGAGEVINNGFRVAQSIDDPNTIQALSGRINGTTDGAGGVMFYLAGHLYLLDGFYNEPTDIQDLEQLNGVRMFLNAVTSQAFRPSTCTNTAAFEGEISIDIADNPDTVLVNNPLEYTITLSNDACGGFVDNLDTVINLSPDVLFNPADLPADCTYDAVAHNITCSISTTLHSGQQVVYNIPVTPLVTGSFPALATATTSTPEFTITNNVDDEISRAVNTTFEATLQKNSNAPDVTSGQRITYNVTLENIGADDMTGIVIKELPSNVQILEASANVGNFDVDTMEWSINLIPPSFTAILTVFGIVESEIPANSAVVNEACIVKSNEAPLNPGPYPCAQTSSNVTPLKVTKTVEPTSASISDTVTYTIDVENMDTQTLTVSLSDTLPPELDFEVGSLYRYETRSFLDGFDTSTTSSTYTSNFPMYNHETQVYETGAYYYKFGDISSWSSGLTRITGGIMQMDTSGTPLYGGALIFSLPPDILNAKFVLRYRVTSGTTVALNAFPNEQCTGTYENFWSTPQSAVTGSFLSEDISLPEYVLGLSTGICIGIANYDTVTGLFEIGSLELRYSEVSSTPLSNPLSSMDSGVSIPEGEIQRWEYQATVNGDAFDETFLRNFVEVSSPELGTTVVTDVDLDIDLDFDVQKEGSTSSAANGDSVTYTLSISNESPDIRTVSIQDVLPTDMVYSSGSISAVNTIHTSILYEENFSVAGLPIATYPSIGFSTSFEEISDNDLWNSGDIFVGTNGYLVFSGDSATSGFRIPDLDFSNPAIVEANLIYDYYRTGPSWVIQHYFQVGGGAREQLLPSLPSAARSETSFQTFTVSLQKLITAGSSQTNLEFILASTGSVPSASTNFIAIDNIRVEIILQTVDINPVLSPPPTISPSFLFNPRDSLTITYEAVVTDPTTFLLTNTLTVDDSVSGLSYVEEYSVHTLDAIDDTADTINLQPVTIDPLNNDIGDADPFSVRIITAPNEGIATVNTSTGVINYIPNSGGNDFITYEVCLINYPATCEQAQVQILNSVAPTTVTDIALVNEDEGPVTINVLDNDFDENGDSFQVVSFSQPDSGSIVFTAACQCFDYTPSMDFNGFDMFNYTVRDSTGLESTGQVNITVLPVNDPIMANDDAENTSEDTPISIDVLANDINVDNDNVIVASFTQPQNGTVTSNANGTLTYTPDSNFHGTDTFEYTAESDSGDTATATVTITVYSVNDPIQAINDTAILDEDSSIELSVLANDINPDNENLDISIVSTPLNGTVTVNNFDESITYIPDSNYNGQDSFVYMITAANGNTSTAEVTITIRPVNDPIIANDDVENTSEDTPIEIFVLGNDENIDGDELSILSTTEPQNGSIVSSGTSIMYTPDPNFNGIDTFNYTITSTSGDIASAIVTITVTPENDSITAVDDSAITQEDIPVVIYVTANDTNVDGDNIMVINITSPSAGSATINTNNSITYTPNENFNGVDTFEYTIESEGGDISTATVTVLVEAVNDPIEAVNDSSETNEDVDVVIDILSNDINVDGDSLTVAVLQPLNGAVTVNADNTLTYSPNDNFFGSDSFTYEITSPNGDTSSANVTVTVISVNDPIVAFDDTVSTPEDTAITINVLDNDVNVDDDNIYVDATTPPTHGSVTINANNTLTYIPNPNFNGEDAFNYTIISDAGDISTAVVVVTVVSVNDPLVANDDTASTDEDTSVLIDILDNDVDIDGDQISIVISSPPSNGNIIVHANNTVTYVPSPNYHGTDNFEYTITSEHDTATANVIVIVNAVNDPIVANDDDISTPEDVPVNIAVLENDENVDNDSLSIIIAPTDVPTNGSITVETNGTITYVPDANFNGEDNFVYTITSTGGDTSTALVTVFVFSLNDPLTARNDSISMEEDTTAFINVLSNDIDPDSESLTVTIETQAGNGNAIVGIDGIIEYSPSSNFFGEDSFVYRITAPNGDTSTATVTITVTPQNDPIQANDDYGSTLEDVPVLIDVLMNDTNVDGDNLFLETVSVPLNGVVDINSNGTVTYTPNSDFNGNDSFVYSVSSESGDVDTATVYITVIPQNDPIMAVDDFVEIPEDSATSISVLSNDINVDHDQLSVTSVTLPLNGTVVIESNGTLTYTPDLHYHGEDSFNYTITSESGDISSATVFITVNPVNDPIEANPDTIEIEEDSTALIYVLGNDVNVDDDSLTVSITDEPLHGNAIVLTNGTIVYQPNNNYNGEDILNYTITSSSGDTSSSSVTITVTPVNDPIIANDDMISTMEDTAVEIEVLINDQNVDGDSLTVINSTVPAFGTVILNNNGTVTYIPNSDFNGQDSFVYTISSENGDTSSATVMVTVDPVNDPIFANDDTSSTDEDVAVNISILSNDENVDNDTLTVTISNNSPHGITTVNADNTITFVPDMNFNGDTSFQYTITSPSGDIDTALVTVTVNPVNDPIIAHDNIVSTLEDTAIEIEVLANDINVDEDSLIISATTSPQNGTIVVNTNGTITYTPFLNFHGADTFTYTISSPNDTDTATVTINVFSSDDPLTAINDTVTCDEDSFVTIPVVENDFNPDGTITSVSIVSAPSNGEVSVNNDNTVTYIPDADYNGTDMFDYQITSSDGSTATATVTIDILPINDPIIALTDIVELQEDTPVDIDVLANDRNADSDALSITAVGSPSHGQVVINADNTITYIPDPNYNGEDSFTYTITSDSGDIDIGTVSLTVTSVNDPIQASDDVVTTDEDVAVIIAVLDNDENLDNDALTVSILTPPLNGDVVVGVDNTITYVPNANFNGQDAFEYSVATDDEFATASVFITVNPVDDPFIPFDDTVLTIEDTPVDIEVLANDSNADNQSISLHVSSNPTHGVVIINQNNTITYIPNDNYHGTDIFEYSVVTETGEIVSATVSVTVLSTDDPIIAEDDFVQTDEDQQVIMDVLQNDLNPDGGAISLTISQLPSHGTVTVNPDETILYVPNENYNGPDSFEYTITSASGYETSAIVFIDVSSVDDPINAIDDETSTREDTPVTISVLANDENVDELELEISSFSLPSNGIVIYNDDDTFTYTPNNGFFGQDSFTYTVTTENGESEATVLVTVVENRPPEASADEIVLTSNESITFTVLANDRDIDGDELQVSIVTPPLYGTAIVNPDGSITYQPDITHPGMDTLTYEICDPFGACASAQVTIISNFSPVAVDDFVSTAQTSDIIIDVLSNDLDPEGEPLRIVSVSEEAHGLIVINPDQTLTYSPEESMSTPTTVEFSYTIADSNGQESSAVVIIEFINNPPVAIDDFYIVNPGESLNLFILDNDYDLDVADELRVVDFTTPSVGTLSLEDDVQCFFYTAPEDYSGDVIFTYVVSDSHGASTTGTVTITIPLPNIDVLSVHDDEISVTTERPVTIDVIANDFGVPSPLDLESLIISSPPSHGSVTVNADGSVVYISSPGYIGTDIFEYEICNVAQSKCNTATVSVVVFPAPLAPIAPTTPSMSPSPLPISNGNIQANPDEIQIPENSEGPIIILPLENDVGDLNPATLSIVNPPEFGDATVVGNQIQYFPAPEFFGVEVLQYRVCSFDNRCASAVVTIEVFPNDLFESSSSTTSSEDDSWCIGGILVWLFACVIGFTGLQVSNNAWHLLFLMQIIATTGQLGISYPQFYLDFTSCFGWSILDMPLPWDVDGFTVLVDGLGGHGRRLLDFESWVDVIDIDPEVLLWGNFFWALIVLILVFIVMLIVFVIATVLQYFIIQSSKHKDQVEEQGGMMKSLVLEALEHFIRALLIFLQVVYFGLVLTAFIIIGYYFRHVDSTELIAPFIVSVIIVLLALIWIIFLSVAYFVYRTQRWLNAHVIRTLGFFYLHYRSTVGWWNTINLARFYLIAATVGLLLGWGAAQLSVLLAIFIVYVIALIIFRPYQQIFPMLIDLLISVFVIIILVLLFIVWGMGSDTSAGEWILRVIIWMFWLAIVLYVLLLLVYLFYVVVTYIITRKNIESDSKKKNYDDNFLSFGTGGRQMERRQHGDTLDN